MAELESFIIRPYQKGDNKYSFSCGVPELDHYFSAVLSQDIKRNLAAGYVLWDDEGATVAGYFTISSIHIVLDQIPDQYKKKLPYNEVPFLLLGRLAIDQGYKGCGLGKNLLMSVFELTCRLKAQMGVWGLAVDPVNQEAEDFYSKFDFQKLPADERMFINVQSLEKLFR